MLASVVISAAHNQCLAVFVADALEKLIFSKKPLLSKLVHTRTMATNAMDQSKLIKMHNPCRELEHLTKIQCIPITSVGRLLNGATSRKKDEITNLRLAFSLLLIGQLSTRKIAGLFKRSSKLPSK